MRDDPAHEARWKARDVYDLAIAVIDWDGVVVVGGCVAVESQRWLERLGALSEAQLEGARDYIAARPGQLGIPSLLLGQR